jgi:hypothetical protein
VINEKYFDHPLGFYLLYQQWMPHILYVWGWGWQQHPF